MNNGIRFTYALTIALIPAVACGGGANGTQPHAMSASEHQAAATAEEQASQGHAAQYDPAASTTKKTCSAAKAGEVCWTSEVNPTATHGEEAEQHQQLAARHRAASQALRSAEASTCAGVPQEDRDMSPFMHREDIRSVEPLREEVKTGRNTISKVVGAEVVFAAVPGMTAEWLQRVVDCHIARNSALGHEQASTEVPYCPLTLRGVQARVRSVGDGFAVGIRGADEATMQEVVRRAEALRVSRASTP